MSNYANLPAPTPEGGLNRYMQEIRKFPMLDPEEEYILAKRWVEEQDTEAAHKMELRTCVWRPKLLWDIADMACLRRRSFLKQT